MVQVGPYFALCVLPASFIMLVLTQPRIGSADSILSGMQNQRSTMAPLKATIEQNSAQLTDTQEIYIPFLAISPFSCQAWLLERLRL